MDSNGDYYYNDDSVGIIYDDKIVEHGKEVIDTVGPFITHVGAGSSTSANMKTLIDDMLQKLLANNQVR